MTAEHIFVIGSGLCGSRAFSRTIGLHPQITEFPWELLLLSGMPGTGTRGLVSCTTIQPHEQSSFWSQLPLLFHRHVYSGDVFSGFHRVLSEREFYDWAHQFWRALMTTEPETDIREKVIVEAYRAIIDLALSRTDALGLQKNPAVKYAIDRSPAYITCIEFILRNFPEAKIFHLVRNGLDVAHSCVRRGWYASYEDALHNWQNLVDRGLRVRKEASVKTIPFGKINEDKLQVFLNVLSHLDLPPENLEKILKQWKPEQQTVHPMDDRLLPVYEAYLSPLLPLVSEPEILSELTKHLS